MLSVSVCGGMAGFIEQFRYITTHENMKATSAERLCILMLIIIT